MIIIAVKGLTFDTNLVNLEYAYGVDRLRFSSPEDLKVHYDNYTMIAPTSPPAAGTGKRKKRSAATPSPVIGNPAISSAHHNPNLCVLYAKSTAFYNANKYNGVLCPPFKMMLTFPDKHNGTLNMILNPLYKEPNTTTVETCAERRELCTTAGTTAYAQPVEIHSAAQESELFGLFDNILPLGYYEVNYVSPSFISCKLNNASGLTAASFGALQNNTDQLCYNAIKRELILEKHIHSHRCHKFYQLVDHQQHTYVVFENSSAVKADKAWTMAQKSPCENPVRSAAFATIAMNFVILFSVMIISTLV